MGWVLDVSLPPDVSSLKDGASSSRADVSGDLEESDAIKRHDWEVRTVRWDMHALSCRPVAAFMNDRRAGET